MQGNVSTANNGGFIQIRKNLKDINLKDAAYVKITAKAIIKNILYIFELQEQYCLGNTTN